MTEDKLTRVADNVVLIESEMEKDRITILGLQNRAMNQTLQMCKDETKDQIQDLKLQTVLYQIEALKFEVKLQILNFTLQLEFDCSLEFNRLKLLTKPWAAGMKLSSLEILPSLTNHLHPKSRTKIDFLLFFPKHQRCHMFQVNDPALDAGPAAQQKFLSTFSRQIFP